MARQDDTVERLSATDAAFLSVEALGLPMHVGALVVLSGGGLVSGDGGLDVDAVQKRLAVGIANEPRFRQRLVRLPVLGAAWVEDPRFDLAGHVGHTAVPRPGGRAELMALAGRLFATPLPQTRPLWEIWLLEGLEGGRFGLLLKVHHAMVDGVAGIGLLASLLTTEPDARPPRVILPREVLPISRLAVARSLATQRVRVLGSTLSGFREHARHRDHALSEARALLSGIVPFLRDGLSPAPHTAINPSEVSQRRGFSGARLDFERVKRVRRALGGTINDVALTVVTGALRRYLGRRGEDLQQLSRFRALVPVNLRPRGGHDGAGNHVSVVIAALPVHEPDARARHAAICASTEHLKARSHEIETAALVEQIGDIAIPRLVDMVMHTAMRLRAFNIVVTNLPGPPIPLHLGAARIEEIFGLVPLFAHQGAGIVVLSYDGGLFFGIQTDAEAITDPDALVRDIEDAFEELTTLAGAQEMRAAPA